MPGTRLLIAPGALVNPQVFLEEIDMCGLDSSRIGIDGNAAVIEGADIAAERALDLQDRLGSTGSGVGAAVSRRVLRDSGFRQAKDHPDLAPFITSVRRELASVLAFNGSIVVEGTQGFGLSLVPCPEVAIQDQQRYKRPQLLGRGRSGSPGTSRS